MRSHSGFPSSVGSGVLLGMVLGAVLIIAALLGHVVRDLGQQVNAVYSAIDR